jgi:hypothetical protein
VNLAKPHKSIDNPVLFCSPMKERLRREAGRFLQRFTVLYLLFFWLLNRRFQEGNLKGRLFFFIRKKKRSLIIIGVLCFL